MKPYAMICGAGLLIIPVSADAATGNWYGGLSGDLTWMRHTDTGGGGNLELGYHLTPNVRVEAEAGYHGADGSGSFNGTHYFSYMGNAYYDFTSMGTSGWRVTPYLGFGLGDASIHYGSNSNNFATTFHHHRNQFAYQGMAGVGFVPSSMSNTVWYVGYRYLGTDNDNINSNSAELGVRFNF